MLLLRYIYVTAVVTIVLYNTMQNPTQMSELLALLTWLHLAPKSYNYSVFHKKSETLEKHQSFTTPPTYTHRVHSAFNLAGVKFLALQSQ